MGAMDELQKEAVAMKSLLEAEKWAEAEPAALRLLSHHSTKWARFADTLWGLEAQATLCISRHALNNTESFAVLQPCRAATNAPEVMRIRLDSAMLMKCQVALAELLEREMSIAEALKHAQAAEALLGDTQLDDM